MVVVVLAVEYVVHDEDEEEDETDSDFGVGLDNGDVNSWFVEEVDRDNGVTRAQKRALGSMVRVVLDDLLGLLPAEAYRMEE